MLLAGWVCGGRLSPSTKPGHWTRRIVHLERTQLGGDVSALTTLIHTRARRCRRHCRRRRGWAGEESAPPTGVRTASAPSGHPTLLLQGHTVLAAFQLIETLAHTTLQGAAQRTDVHGVHTHRQQYAVVFSRRQAALVVAIEVVGRSGNVREASITVSVFSEKVQVIGRR